MKTEIRIANHQKKIPLKSSRIRKVLKEILKFERVSEAVLSVVFVTDRKIKSLNKKYLKKDYATDVLAFDLGGDIEIRVKPKPRPCRTKKISGEIIISTDTAKRNARVYGTTAAKELVLYLIHGVLHLLGYDDHKAKDIKRIRKREKQILELLRK